MFKNMKFGMKIGGGFAVLLILLGFVAAMGFNGLRQVNQRVIGMTAAKDITIKILEARREEKNFIIRGGTEYIDKVGVAVKALDASVTTLSGSGLTAGQSTMTQGIGKASQDYQTAFKSYTARSASLSDASTRWKELGDQLSRQLSSLSNPQVNSGFLLLRLSAVYYLKDKNDERWNELQASAQAFTTTLEQWIATGKAGANGRKIAETGRAYIAMGEQVRGLFREQAELDAAMVSTGRSVIDNAAKVEEELGAELGRTSAFATLSILASAAGALLLGVLLAVFLTRGITRPVRKAVRFAGLLSSCDFSGLLDLSQKDEMGVLASSLNDIAVRLRSMCVTIQESAEQVSASSEQIAASAQSLANGSQSQASALEQTSAAVQELAASVEQVAEHAQSQAASGEEGSSAMSQVRTSIDAISKNLSGIASLATHSVEKSVEGAQAVQKVVEAISRISGGSEKIAGIVNVISEIADQTNLLALNASIEAARAGEHGRGFAVVAEEVSKLADRSASSTKEIESLIRESVQSVSQGVQIAQSSHTAMDQIRDASQQVKTMIEDLSLSLGQQIDALKELVGAIQNISEMSQSISAATEEQTTNAKEVSKAVENVSELTQSTASAAEQMSAATEQLTGMATQLKTLVAGFKTGTAVASVAAAGAAPQTLPVM